MESDYPELGGDFNFGGLSNNSPPLPGSNQKSSSSKTSNASSIYANQMILCRRLKLDLRNDTETAIAGEKEIRIEKNVFPVTLSFPKVILTEFSLFLFVSFMKRGTSIFYRQFRFFL